MDRFRAPTYVCGALVFLCLSLSPAQADVKLRIYLQDGSLQAGNLITENAETFVILNKEGQRVEIPRKNIMFINGKTIKQWEERPDKFFQTEIMPSEVPDPAFVNNKAALPKAPAIKSVPPLPKAVTEKLAEKSEPVVIQEKPAASPTPTPVAEKKAEKPAERSEEKPTEKQVSKPKPQVKPAVTETAKAPVPAVSAAASTSPAKEKKGGNRRLQERAAKGASHREQAIVLLAQGEKGQAMQHFLIARLMEPDNGETYLALARMSKDDGLYEQALKHYGHWTLRKSKEAADEIVIVNQLIEAKKKSQLYLQIMAAAGAMSWIPAFLIARRFRRRRPTAAAVEEAVAVDAAVEGPLPKPADWVAEAEAVFSEVETPVAVPPAPVVERPRPVAPPPPPAPLPLPETVAEKPMPLPEFKPAPIPEPMAEEPALPVEPVVVPEPASEPEAPPAQPLEPVFQAASGEPAPDPHLILSMARGVENALVRGNAAATEGRSDEARRSYRTALALNVDCGTAHLGLGYLAFTEEKWDTALLHYRKALDIDPSSADAHYGVARVLLEVNRVEDAIPELRATLLLDPTYADAQDALTTLGKPS